MKNLHSIQFCWFPTPKNLYLKIEDNENFQIELVNSHDRTRDHTGCQHSNQLSYRTNVICVWKNSKKHKDEA